MFPLQDNAFRLRSRCETLLSPIVRGLQQCLPSLLNASFPCGVAAAAAAAAAGLRSFDDRPSSQGVGSGQSRGGGAGAIGRGGAIGQASSSSSNRTAYRAFISKQPQAGGGGGGGGGSGADPASSSGGGGLGQSALGQSALHFSQVPSAHCAIVLPLSHTAQGHKGTLSCVVR